VGNAGLFASATWLVDTDERAWAFRDAARAAAGFSAYSALERAPTRLIEGDADYDVFGDGTVTIIQAPGHTPGHTVLLVRLAEAGPVLLAGDIWNTPDSQLQRRGTPEAQATLDKVERIVSANRARLIRQHIAADFDALPLYPGYLR
jgi:glyoxylase-like metal-dependent hydrolase (beta-lactamase superfamily II)